MSFVSRKPRRPKPGTGFLLVRLIGWFLKFFGGLLIVSALAGSIVTLVRVSSTLIGALRFPEQKMAGFIVLMILGYLLVFLLLGLVGVIVTGIGFGFSRWGTEPVVTSTGAAAISEYTTLEGSQGDKEKSG
jgi:hypothetical protein